MSVTDMTDMFRNAGSFNTDIGTWNTESLIRAGSMFSSATNFNQDISNWNVSSITNMSSMFSSATNFNQDISGWTLNTSNPPDLTLMFDDSGMVGNAFGLSTPTPLVSEFGPPPPPPPPSNPDLTPCFLHDTLISTTRGLVKVQDLQYGDLVETYDHGAVPLTYLGVKVISHMAKDTRDPNQLYVCSKDHFPSAINDLVMTGCHSIFLFRGFKDEQEKRDVCAINGDVYVTDRQLRFPICALRDSVKVYPEKGTFNIYHFSLAHNDEFMNYMVYANNLPVETASNSYMVYCSGMKLIGNTSPVRKTIHNDEPVTKHTKLVDDNFTLA
jgi:surface protein